MSAPLRRLTPSIIAFLTSERAESLVRGAASLPRRLRGRARVLDVFLRPDDPYSHLLVQALDRVRAAYEVELRIRVPGPSEPGELGDPELWPAYARRDAAAIAGGFGLRFGDAAEPAPDLVATAERVMVRHRSDPDALDVFLSVGDALWSGDRRALDALPAASEGETARELRDASDERARGGHYLAATVRYEGEWYWGVDRLELLERRLLGEGARILAGDEPLTLAPEPARDADHAPARVELFYSFRSPYAYLGLERALALFADRPVELVPRPIAPMVKRGVQASRAKRVYIVRDVARLARAAGVPFGYACDPLPGFLRAAALYEEAVGRGLEVPYLRAYGRSVWSEGLDVMRDDDLRTLALEVGLDWGACAKRLRAGEAPLRLEENAAALYAHGLWGVPTFVTKGRAFWGQDRLWLLDRTIRQDV